MSVLRIHPKLIVYGLLFPLISVDSSNRHKSSNNLLRYQFTMTTRVKIQLGLSNESNVILHHGVKYQLMW